MGVEGAGAIFRQPVLRHRRVSVATPRKVVGEQRSSNVFVVQGQQQTWWYAGRLSFFDRALCRVRGGGAHCRWLMNQPMLREGGRRIGYGRVDRQARPRGVPTGHRWRDRWFWWRRGLFHGGCRCGRARCDSVFESMLFAIWEWHSELLIACAHFWLNSPALCLESGAAPFRVDPPEDGTGGTNFTLRCCWFRRENDGRY